jgi:hypothetical protein
MEQYREIAVMTALEDIKKKNVYFQQGTREEIMAILISRIKLSVTLRGENFVISDGKWRGAVLRIANDSSKLRFTGIRYFIPSLWRTLVLGGLSVLALLKGISWIWHTIDATSWSQFKEAGYFAPVVAGLAVGLALLWWYAIIWLEKDELEAELRPAIEELFVDC